eukprot:CAMPEP_0115030188 /NCGR_PEP_ID=MMETSP0216-20121206/37582_1 /TAXON_ID=223996 /ORGANISM="Protocruzia adherens, Strain Boccale" /LENGTH=495 /DNA_ID=CAMNT_0002407185 /DNA_START=257 /DNA_END=1744 /DNA_ORIENTATION=-
MVDPDIERFSAFRFEETDFDIVNPLAKGVYGFIYEAYCKSLKKKVALKMIKINSQKHQERILQEHSILEQIDHPNIIQTYGYYEGEVKGKKYSFIVMELFGKNLDEYGSEIKEKILAQEIQFEDERWGEDKLMDFITQIGSAIHYLHVEKKIAHRDIKLANILYDEVEGRRVYKLCDFGESKRIEDLLETHTLRGTPKYLSPELFHFYVARQQSNLSEQKIHIDPFKSDLFSLGVSIIELFSFCGLRININSDKANKDNTIKELRELGVCKRIIAILKRLLEYTPKERADAHELWRLINADDEETRELIETISTIDLGETTMESIAEDEKGEDKQSINIKAVDFKELIQQSRTNQVLSFDIPLTSTMIRELGVFAARNMFTNLTSLNLTAKNLTDEDCLYIKAIIMAKNHTKLSSLNLSHNNITDNGMKHIVFAIRDRPVLKLLDVSYTKITDNSVFLISNMIDREFDNIIIIGTDITDYGESILRIKKKEEQQG